jgi:hypothetical protein
MIAFIDDHRVTYEVEPICKVLPIAPSTYHDHVAKRHDPSKLSVRAKRDAVLTVEVRRVFEENFRVYGMRKVWRQLQREGTGVARCTVTRPPSRCSGRRPERHRRSSRRARLVAQAPRRGRRQPASLCLPGVP